MTATYLDSIVAAHRARAADDHRPMATLLEVARSQPAPRGFADRLRRDAADGQLAVIAEVKRRSPSKGAIDADLDAAELARDYERGGASCISVLTDTDHFGGSRDDLEVARDAVDCPVLRKDFTVSALDVCDARLMDADAVLLIVAALDQHELRDFHALALELELDALVEIHDEAELDRAMDVGATLVGVNQRDLVTFEVDTARAVRLAPLMPADVVRVAESGIGSVDDARPLAAAGYHAVLVGESLVRSADPADAVAGLRTIAVDIDQ
jgi:indole-3-glycerol phosphate synthase